MQGLIVHRMKTNPSRGLHKLAKEHLHINDASVFAFAACHLLAIKENAGIIIIFKDLHQCNIWIQIAKLLKTHENKFSTAPDLTPVLRPLTKELLHKLLPSPKKCCKYLPSSAVALCRDENLKRPYNQPQCNSRRHCAVCSGFSSHDVIPINSRCPHNDVVLSWRQ